MSQSHPVNQQSSTNHILQKPIKLTNHIQQICNRQTTGCDWSICKTYRSQKMSNRKLGIWKVITKIYNRARDERRHRSNLQQNQKNPFRTIFCQKLFVEDTYNTRWFSYLSFAVPFHGYAKVQTFQQWGFDHAWLHRREEVSKRNSEQQARTSAGKRISRN